VAILPSGLPVLKKKESAAAGIASRADKDTTTPILKNTVILRGNLIYLKRRLLGKGEAVKNLWIIDY
jgi:hypothetical protein